jgi:hypothetical protein
MCVELGIERGEVAAGLIGLMEDERRSGSSGTSLAYPFLVTVRVWRP